MNKLTLAVDTKNHYMQVTRLASYNNYAASSGATEIPAGARFVEIRPTSAGVWFTTGSLSSITATAPSGAVTNGSAPSYVAQGDSLVFELTPGHTHLAVSGAALLSYWE